MSVVRGAYVIYRIPDHAELIAFAHDSGEFQTGPDGPLGERGSGEAGGGGLRKLETDLGEGRSRDAGDLRAETNPVGGRVAGGPGRYLERTVAPELEMHAGPHEFRPPGGAGRVRPAVVGEEREQILKIL